MFLSRRAFRFGIRVSGCLFAVFWSGACVRTPVFYPVPEQRDNHFEPSAIEPPFIEMGSWNAADFIVRDVGAFEGAFRWTFERPELRFVLNSTERWAFVADIGMVDTTLSQTGPITISAWVNGHPLADLRCDKGGAFRLRKAVPAAWLKEREYNHVMLRASKVFVAADGVKLSFVLYRAGFVNDD